MKLTLTIMDFENLGPELLLKIKDYGIDIGTSLIKVT
ncbi:MAG: hypothetical protein ACJAT1_001732, partial [Marivirga sp.]